ncbi:hypothetical protein CY34DRAFT_27310 [Suillus luteus UH-Slu-Lm8-n1]|uniref:Uncharacterized protein n=1 Tax=Suillus luteus UH-Slu-Lm8-n1 TaxID=930992 RepID=A0A0D0AI11_9AGAM|nr:hypothetical protein CY34DRAFT_27310 [Suillus luteus UH-Slu-Lm8-n1]
MTKKYTNWALEEDSEFEPELHKLAYKLIHLTTVLLPTWHKALHASGQSITNMPWDVATQWNLTFNMLKYALDHQDAIDIVTQSQGLDLHKFELTNILKDATTFFSRSTPNLATVIPAMDLIHETLTSYSCNQRYHTSIRVAVHLAKKTLNRYYELTDKSKVYHIAMGVCFLFAFLLPSPII